MKWQQIHIYQQLILKHKINKQNRNRIREHFDGCQMEGGVREWAKRVKGLKTTNW